MKSVIIGLISVIALSAIVFFTYISKNDHEVKLKEDLFAQNDVVINHFDNMFKVISQTAQVPKEFMSQSKEAFKEIYQPLIEGRYQDQQGNQQQMLMKWVTESNPQFEMSAATELYAKIQVVIESQRNEFTTQQDKLRAFHAAHNKFCRTFWNKNIFGMGKRQVPKCEGKVDFTDVDDNCVRYINSTNTKNTIETGNEDDINVFS